MEGIVEGTVGEEAVAGVVVIAEEGEEEVVVVVIVEGVANERSSRGWCCGFDVLGYWEACCTFTAS